jgi:hypothetical protein
MTTFLFLAGAVHVQNICEAYSVGSSFPQGEKLECGRKLVIGVEAK